MSVKYERSYSNSNDKFSNEKNTLCHIIPTTDAS